MNPSDYRRVVDRLLERLHGTEELVKKERKRKDHTEVRLRSLEEAQQIAQAVAEKLQSKAHERIAEIVTKSLEIFDEPYEFRIDFKRARGRTEAHLLFVRDGVEVDPLLASGGGVVDVAAFALRVACLVLRRPPLRRVLFLDEPFRFVSREYRPRIHSLLESLSRDLGVQFVTVTHDPKLHGGLIVSLANQ